jgi:hypothetical protein
VFNNFLTERTNGLLKQKLCPLSSWESCGGPHKQDKNEIAVNKFCDQFKNSTEIQTYKFQIT